MLRLHIPELVAQSLGKELLDRTAELLAEDYGQTRIDVVDLGRAQCLKTNSQ